MSKLSWWRILCVVCVFCTAAAMSSRAEALSTLLSFGGANGNAPSAALVQGLDGNLYGTTFGGGDNDSGTVFKITPAGKLSTLYNFCSQPLCRDGANPAAALLLATDGNFYGTTEFGGANLLGTAFEISAAGKLTSLYSFCSKPACADGGMPVAGLVQATNGNFYGTTEQEEPSNYGTVFEMTTAGKLSTLYSFCSLLLGCPDGAEPDAGLVQATNGNFYGTTNLGGAYSIGVVFKITPSGKLTTLHSFNGTDGGEPYAGLVQATNGNFYGTTSALGNFKDCLGGCGTVFSMTGSGMLTTLHSFNGTDGANSEAGLVQATDGNFYGTTAGGGTSSRGTVFEISAAGKLTTLHSFSGTDGGEPYAELVQATNGNFYGTTDAGGAHNFGTVFVLSAALGQFVETLPTSGKVGATVIILGNSLTGTTSVAFNVTPAKFTVVSSTEIKATVPVGATTGKVKVKTPSRTLTSNVSFQVTP
ncbi:MAG: hypothetical protein JOZ29_04865 [Deltaproteobacteria bacterium]|nr:hypothetical protein [Deltaproteobacteria bacterium]